MKRINLALQGGGAHGAFTWGVLDRFLEEDGIEIAAITGTSAGALNGAALKSGLLEGGRQGARDRLNWVWEQVGARDDSYVPVWMKAWMPDPSWVRKSMEMSAPFMFGDFMSRMSSPYHWGPFYSNPLKPVVDALSFDKVCALDGPDLYVCATNVRSGKIRIFNNKDISTDAILASACLPTMFKAVEIDDPVTGRKEFYWDGGYTGNPALFPLFKPDLPDDIVIVNINPLHREDVPRQPADIHNRINEISFNSSLLRELRAIHFVQRLLRDGSLQQGTMSNPKIHLVSDDILMNDLSVATKQSPIPSVLARLKDAGQAAADTFLRTHKSDLNVTQTADLEAMFGTEVAQGDGS